MLEGPPPALHPAHPSQPAHASQPAILLSRETYWANGTRVVRSQTKLEIYLSILYAPSSKEEQEKGDDYLEKMIKDVHQIPEDFDYSSSPRVLSPTDQGGCGSCYAHVATGIIEGQMWKIGLPTRRLGYQKVVECTGRGCCTGSVTEALLQLSKQEILAYNSSHPPLWISGFQMCLTVWGSIRIMSLTQSTLSGTFRDCWFSNQPVS